MKNPLGIRNNNARVFSGDRRAAAEKECSFCGAWGPVDSRGYCLTPECREARLRASQNKVTLNRDQLRDRGVKDPQGPLTLWVSDADQRPGEALAQARASIEAQSMGSVRPNPNPAPKALGKRPARVAKVEVYSTWAPKAPADNAFERAIKAR